MAKNEENKELFILDVNVQIRKVNRVGGYDQWTNEQINVSEKIELGTLDFIEVAAILGQFHELAETIKKEREKRSGNS